MFARMRLLLLGLLLGAAFAACDKNSPPPTHPDATHATKAALRYRVSCPLTYDVRSEQSTVMLTDAGPYRSNGIVVQATMVMRNENDKNARRP